MSEYNSCSIDEFYQFRLGSNSLEVQQYICPKHGPVAATISSCMPSYKAEWCMLCFYEKLDELGVMRATKPTHDEFTHKACLEAALGGKDD